MKICVDFKKLKKATKENPYPLKFYDELLNIVIGYEAYSILDGYLEYRQFSIALENRYKTIFVIDQGTFLWMVMPIGVKNGPPTFQKTINRICREYLDQFMKII